MTECVCVHRKIFHGKKQRHVTGARRKFGGRLRGDFVSVGAG